MTDELAGLNLSEIHRRLDLRELTSEELTRAALDRIRAHDGELGAFATVSAEAALTRAREVDHELRSGGRRTPLHGVPIAIKDNTEVEGVPLHAGSAVLEGYISGRDATTVTRLRAAGAVILGKTQLDEFSYSTTGPGIVNPAAPERTPGGSSGGSAVAVAAGFCPVALGTDAGGSVRIPASCCGVVGFKPTYGLIDATGIIPLAWSLDHVGSIGRRVADVRAMFDVLAEARPLRAGEQHRRSGDAAAADVEGPLGGLRIGLPDARILATVVPSVRRAFSSAVDILVDRGATPVTVELPDLDEAMEHHYIVALAEIATYHLRRFGSRDDYRSGIGSAIRAGAEILARDYLDAQRARARAGRVIDAAFDRVDVLALPTMAIEPPPVGAERVALGDGREVDVVPGMIRLTYLFNDSGHPAISVPIATNDLPAGLQLVGRRCEDRHLLDVAEVLEAACVVSGA